MVASQAASLGAALQKGAERLERLRRLLATVGQDNASPKQACDGPVTHRDRHYNGIISAGHGWPREGLDRVANSTSVTVLQTFRPQRRLLAPFGQDKPSRKRTCDAVTCERR